ncbi:MAG: HEAT repeat domain-containing protein [Planctomycetes bacterium]|nr:HEAT repeat domain-containing protein [Planctomycetota bacterium]
MSHELTETLVEPLTRLGLTVERAGLSLRVAVDLERIMTVTPNAEGVVFCHQLSAEAGAQELPARLNRLNRESDFARYVLRPTGVWAECTLPFAGRSLAPNQLHVACGELDAAIRRYHRSEAQPDDPGAAPTLVHGQTVDRDARTVGVKAAVDRGAATVPLSGAEIAGANPDADPTRALPASYLAGSGQLTPEDRTTRRYGARNAVPGRPDPAAHGRSHSGGGRGGVLALGLLVLLGGAAAAAYVAHDQGWVRLSGPAEGDEVPEGPQPSAADSGKGSQPSDGEDPSDGGDGSSTQTPDPTEPEGGWTPLGTEEEDPAPRPPPTELPPSWPELLDWIRAHPERAAEATRAAIARPALNEPGGWLALVEALGAHLGDRAVMAALTRQARSVPPPLRDSLDCLPRATGSLRSALLERVIACKPEERDLVATALEAERVRDTPDLLIDQTLVRLGRPAPESLARLIERHGDDWLVFGLGRPLLDGLGREAAGKLEALVRARSPRVRAAAAEACALSSEPRAALKVLTSLLRDPLADVRELAIESMVKLESPLACWPIARRLELETDGGLSQRLRTALRTLAGQQRTVELLEQLYRRPQVRDRRAALLGLEATGSTDAVAAIVGALDDGAPELQLLALRQLARVQRQPAMRPHVLKGIARIRELAQEHPDREVAGAARDLFVQLTGNAPR